jgi:diguanylate cyclase (GGDEF)-like protein/PAS domain S-box-containing protein
MDTNAAPGPGASAEAGPPGMLEAFLARSSDAVLVTDHHGRVAMINGPAELLFGYELGGLLGQPVQQLFPGGLPSPGMDHPDGNPDRRWREAEVTLRGRHRDGTEIPLHASVTYPDDPMEYASVVFLRPSADVGPEPPVDADGKDPAALQDPLTGLPRVVLFMDRVSVALAGSARKSSLVAVLLLDIDRFRLVNDSYGRDIGDKVLVGVAERLFGVLRPGDSLARVSEDEFAILCDDIAKAEGAATIAARAHAAVNEPFSFDGETVMVTSSLGFAVGSGQLNSPESLFRRAEEALDRAKDRGPGNLESYDPPKASTAQPAEASAPEPPAEEVPPREPVAAMAAVEPAVQASAEAEPARASAPGPEPSPTGESRLVGAVQRGEFRLAYQPIIRLQNGRIAGVEALLRWQDPERGLLGPGEFMSEAEETGLIHHIGAWVLREVLSEAERLQAADPDGGPLMLSINLSARQFEDPGFVRMVEGILAGSRIDPGTLYMEIGESSVMEDADAAAAVLAELRGVGVRVSIDDFGTGYSSLMHLNRFPIDFLKIDQSFVEGLDRDASAGNIVTAVISMAHALGLPTIAEGVETAEQLYTLRRLGCDYAQGYLFARPQLLPETLRLLASEPTW